MAVMVLPKTLHAGDGHGSDGSGRDAPLVEIEPLSPAWYIETIRLLLHAGRARESYQMARPPAAGCSAGGVTAGCQCSQRFWRLSTRSVTTPGSVSVEVSPSSA
ncbi:MAG: hypothetical protein CM15mP115_13000 [Alphaproteobacteria bacterium]|nr:MAG: hypothetical protein CM15mP115_13000 [Alphaproteobacteria bacterium]